jgi:hypothetical protein
MRPGLIGPRGDLSCAPIAILQMTMRGAERVLDPFGPLWGAFIRFTLLSRAFGPGSEPGLPRVQAKQSGTLGTAPMEAGLRS